MNRMIETIARELKAREAQVVAAIGLLDEGATVPFIARYRKEATDGLDDTQLRTLEERLHYLREMEERRAVILKSVEEQGKLTPELTEAIAAAETKARLEDLYLPHRPKRRTKAHIAREAGLTPLAEGVLATPDQNPEEAAQAFIDAEKGVPDGKTALEGARQILVEDFAEDADLIGRLREYLWIKAKLASRCVAGKQETGAKFADYFDAAESLCTAPSHRALAMFRGRKEEVLTLSLALEESGATPESSSRLTLPEQMVASHFGIADRGRAADPWLLETVRWAWRTRIFPHIEVDLMNRLWEKAEEEAIGVFADNLRALLLAAPAGPRPILALDPGYRTGVKVVVVDGTGKLLETATIYPHEPHKRWDESIAVLADLIHRFGVELVATGNGTASRETDRLVGELIRAHPQFPVSRVMVSEAGASVYSASEYAARELPEVNVSLRGAASIGRRLQDPLAELVKIDPKAIGVGQYQHDVSETKLSRALDAAVEDCVNAVGVNVNTASAPLLARVSGLGESLARNVVTYRDANGPFRRRSQLRDVPRLGPKAFEQAAGFLRIVDGDDPLDNSAVHPEAYTVVHRILESTSREVRALIGDTVLLRSLDPARWTDDVFGVPTIADILKELEKPGRDPRPEFRTASFKEDVRTMNDLQPGMVLEGVVTNVANFGAFVDVGVHQDGLIHISVLSNRFVKDPRAVVKPGDVVKVKVLEVDLKRKRIALSMRLDETPAAPREAPPRAPKAPRPRGNGRNEAPRATARESKSEPPPSGIMAEAFARARERRKEK
ncbi:MAG: uncharacterized protein FD149_1430 [Rhodospirillaceae bacterium]|nr:MAG: uncharacterized protein FD149_1430 [Rhodospirillaceae bacterium]